MLTLSRLMLEIAAVFYGLGLVSALAFKRRPGICLVLVLPALGANAAAVALRYLQAWPMLPMYLGPAALPFSLGVLTLIAGRHEGRDKVRPILLALSLFIALSAVFFPMDFYLPFPKSLSLSAHLFFLFGVAGRACFLVSAVWALHSLRSCATHTDHRWTINDQRHLRWVVWGFAFWTLSMFAGELWSYLGWGTPVVWDDPAIATVMATWFFYVCLLHLHLTATWSARARTIYAIAGALVVLGLNCLPELGPFRWPA